MFKGLYRRFIAICREEGSREALLRLALFLKRFVKNGFKIPRYQTDMRVDTEYRWSLIIDHIDEDDKNVLDVGCADGFLTSKFREEGLFCVGVDRAEHMLDLARSENRYTNGIGFMKYDVTPESVTKFPKFDVVLLLTVYHHWIDAFGVDASETMLQHLMERSEKLLFQPPGRELEDGLPMDSEDTIVEYHRNYLERISHEDAEVIHIRTTEYQGGKRQDPLYLINSIDLKDR